MHDKFTLLYSRNNSVQSNCNPNKNLITTWYICIFINSWTSNILKSSLFFKYQFSSVTQLCPTLCNPMDCSMPGFPVHHQLPELAQTHVHRVGDAIQPPHPLSSVGVQPQQDPRVPSGWTALANEWHGEAKLQWARPVTLFSKGAFIPWLVHRGKWNMQGHVESAQTLQQFCPYRNQDFFLYVFP